MRRPRSRGDPRVRQDDQRSPEDEIERARALIREGADQLGRDEVVDAETFFRQWDEEVAALDQAEGGTSA